jgi:hypothetical protein
VHSEYDEAIRNNAPYTRRESEKPAHTPPRPGHHTAARHGTAPASQPPAAMGHSCAGEVLGCSDLGTTAALKFLFARGVELGLGNGTELLPR